MRTFGNRLVDNLAIVATEPSQALGHGVVKAPSIGFVLEPEDDVVGVAHDDRRPWPPGAAIA